MAKQKRKNDYDSYRIRLQIIGKFIKQTLVTATAPTILLLIVYSTLFFMNPYRYSIYWVQTTPVRLSILVSVVIVLSAIYIFRSRQREFVFSKNRKSMPMRIGVLWFLILAMFCSMSLCRTFQLFPFTYEEVIKVESHNLNLYSLQHIATDYAEFHNHHYQIFECKLNIYCKMIYGAPKYGMTKQIDTIDFYISENSLYVIENGEITRIIEL